MTSSPVSASALEDPPARTVSPDTARADTIARPASPETARATTVARTKSPADTGLDAAVDGGLWRGPTEGPWIARLLRGAPAPRDPAPSRSGPTPRD